MKPLTIKEMWKTTKANNSPLLGQVGKLVTLPFMVEYADRFAEIDRIFAKEKGFMAPVENRDEYATDGEILNEWREDVFAFLYKNKETFQHWWDLMGIEYSPLENYNMIEQGHDDASGKDVNVENLGSKERREQKGQDTLTDTYGAEDESMINGAQQRTDNLGATQNTKEDKRNAFNSAQYTNSTKEQVNGNAVENRINTTQYTDRRTTEQKIDTHVTSARTDVFTENAIENSNQMNYGKKMEHYLTRSGNIGVTTSQQMAESDIALWDHFRFYDMILKEICTFLCNFHDEGYEAFNPLRPYFVDNEYETTHYYNVFAVHLFYDGNTLETAEVVMDDYYVKTAPMVIPDISYEGYTNGGHKINNGQLSAGSATFTVTGPMTIAFYHYKEAEEEVDG